MSTFVGDDRLIKAIRVYGLATAVWPLDPKVARGRLKVLSYKILWWIYVVNGLFEVPAFLASTDRKDFPNMMKMLVELIYVLEAVFNVIYCRVQEKRLQKLFSEIERPDKTWTSYGEILRRRFVHYLRAVCIGATITHVIAVVSFAFSPLLTHRATPLHTWYPLPMTELWGQCVAYGLNMLCIFQATVTMNFDLMMFLLLWNAAFKFALLGMQMRSVFTADKLRMAIIAHQSALSYVRKVNRIVHYAIAKLTVTISIYLISCHLTIVNNVPIIEAIQFFSITSISILRLYCYSWSAQMMTDMAYDVAWQIYDSPWIYALPRIRREVFIIIQRCQKPVVISATGVIPVVSIKFCGEVLYVTFSCFLTLRAILYV